MDPSHFKNKFHSPYLHAERDTEAFTCDGAALR